MKKTTKQILDINAKSNKPVKGKNISKLAPTTNGTDFYLNGNPLVNI